VLLDQFGAPAGAALDLDDRIPHFAKRCFPDNDSSMMKRPRPYADKAAMAILHDDKIFSIKPVTYEVRLRP
jgi:hypothetical protein